MQTDRNQINLWIKLTIPLAILFVLASVVGIFVPEFYHREELTFAAQGIGQDAVNLLIAFPVLVIGAIMARRGSIAGLLIWWGILIYIAYSYVIYAFALEFNRLFLVYTAILGLSVYTLAGSMLSIKPQTLKASFDRTVPHKQLAILLGITATLFYLIWLKDLIPALIADEKPLSVVEAGLASNPVHVLDMGLFLPLLALTAVWMWRNDAKAYVFAAPILVLGIIMGAAIIGMGITMQMMGVAVDMAVTVIFSIIIAVDLGFLIWFLSHMKTDATQENQIPARSIG